MQDAGACCAASVMDTGVPMQNYSLLHPKLGDSGAAAHGVPSAPALQSGQHGKHYHASSASCSTQEASLFSSHLRLFYEVSRL